MALEILYYGADTSHRVSVFVAAGYAVENCRSSSELIQALESREEILAIVFCDHDGSLPLDEIAIVRTRSSAPLILFCDSNGADDASDFNFVIPNLTPPADWLRDIAFVIERHRRSAVQERAKSAKALPIDDPPSKIKLVERESTSAPDSDLQRLSPPPKESTTAGETGSGPHYLT